MKKGEIDLYKLEVKVKNDSASKLVSSGAYDIEKCYKNNKSMANGRVGKFKELLAKSFNSKDDYINYLKKTNLGKTIKFEEILNNKDYLQKFYDKMLDSNYIDNSKYKELSNTLKSENVNDIFSLTKNLIGFVALKEMLSNDIVCENLFNIVFCVAENITSPFFKGLHLMKIG